MPYNLSTGVYALPAIYLAIPGTVIIAAQHNTPLEDLATANNYARPIIAGGTGANNSTSATQNLRAVSYDAQSFIASEKATARRNIIAPYATKNADYTAVADDVGSTLRFTAAATLSLTAAATLANGWAANVIADGGAVTIDPNGSETINGLTTLIVPNGTTAEIICDGSNFFTVFRPSGWQTIEQRTFTAVSAIDFTNLGGFARLRISGLISLSSSGTLGWRSSTNNGTSYDTGASDYSFQGQTTIDTTFGGSRTAAASYGLLGGGGTAESIDTRFNNFNVSGQSCISICTGTAFNGGGSTIFNRQDSAIRNDTTARNALRIIPTTAITLTGTLLLEGAVS